MGKFKCKCGSTSFEAVEISEVTHYVKITDDGEGNLTVRKAPDTEPDGANEQPACDHIKCSVCGEKIDQSNVDDYDPWTE